MDHGHNPKRRFGMTLQQASQSGFRPGIAHGPPLPAVNYGLVGKQAPGLLPTPAGKLPQASAVVITWADAEWAALHHVFCAGSAAMPYTPASWPEYKNGWKASDATLENANFNQLLFPVPTKASDLQTLCSQFNQHYRTNYTLAQLDPNGLNLGDVTPQIDDQTGGEASLLTTSTFVVGTTAGNYQTYTSIEMDDAIIGEACASSGTAFGFVRNVSDPVQSAALPGQVQGNWGSAVYDAYGFYTSYNGAVAAWAMLA